MSDVGLLLSMQEPSVRTKPCGRAERTVQKRLLRQFEITWSGSVLVVSIAKRRQRAAILGVWLMAESLSSGSQYGTRNKSWAANDGSTKQ